MTWATSTAESFTESPDAVTELRVPADPSQLIVIRAVAETVATREDFDLDDIADIKLSVDEACSILIKIAVPGAKLTCRFTASATALDISVGTSTPESSTISQRGFGWHVLSTLTDTIGITRTPGSTAIDFSKSKDGGQE